MPIAGYTPSSQTLGSLVEAVISTLSGQTAQQDSLTALSASIGAGDTSFVVDDTEDISAGLIEVDTELMEVARFDDSTRTVTLRPTGRGRRGTTATTHAAGAEVRIAPLVPYSSVIREVNAELGNLYPSLSWVADYEFQYDPTKITYALPAGVGLVLDVRYKDRFNEWQRVKSWEMEQGQNTTEFASGVLLRIWAPEALSTIRVIYGKPFAQASALADNLGTACGLPSSCEDIIRLGAAIRLLPSFDIARLGAVSVPNAEAAGRSPQPGTGVMVTRELRAMYKERLESEVRAFRLAFPVRQHHTR